MRHCTSVFQNDGVGSCSNIDKHLVPPENQVYGMFSAAKTKLVDFARTTFASSDADRLRLEYLTRLLDDEYNDSSASTTTSDSTTISSTAACVLGGTGGVDDPVSSVSDDVGHILVDEPPLSTVSLLVDSMTIPRKKSKIVEHSTAGRQADVGRPCHEWYNHSRTTTNPFVVVRQQDDNNSCRGNYDDRSMMYGRSVQFANVRPNEWYNRRTTRNPTTTTNRFVNNREQDHDNRRGNYNDDSIMNGPSAQFAHGHHRSEWYNRPTTTNRFVNNREQDHNSHRGNYNDDSLMNGPSAQFAHGHRHSERYNRPTTTNRFVNNQEQYNNSGWFNPNYSSWSNVPDGGRLNTANNATRMASETPQVLQFHR